MGADLKPPAKVQALDRERFREHFARFRSSGPEQSGLAVEGPDFPQAGERSRFGRGRGPNQEVGLAFGV